MNRTKFWLAVACLGILQSSCKRSETTEPQSPSEISSTKNGSSGNSVSALTFQNNVISTANNPKDPQVFRAADGKFWLVHPDDDKYYAYHSTDLINWTKQSAALLTASTGTFWSAGSYKYNSTYNLYFTANNGQLKKQSAWPHPLHRGDHTPWLIPH